MGVFQNSKVKSAYIAPALVLFFSALAFPTSYKTFKIILLCIIGVVFMIWIARMKYIPLNKNIVTVLILMTFTSLVFISLGILRGAPGSIRVSTVYLFWPIVYTLFFSALVYEQIIFKLYKVMVVALLFISVYSFIYIGYMLGLIPSFLYIEFDLSQRMGFNGLYMEYTTEFVTTLLFLVPFCCAALFLWDKSFYTKVNISKKWLFIATVFGIVSSILSGRRALWLILVISIALILILTLYFFKEKRNVFLKRLWLLSPLILVGLVIFFFFTLGPVLKFLGSGILNPGPERADQLVSLLQGWQKYPFFGNGFGSVASVIRSTDAPWSYELSYVNHLFATGIIGTFVFGASVIWVFLYLMWIAKKDQEAAKMILPVLVGTICFLIANFTNPYLGKFDFIWVIFLPVGLLNHYLMKKDDEV